MKSAEIRRSFLEYFRARGHEIRPSSSLVPASDPTLLFTNAGMVQFKGAFLGMEKLSFDRAVTSQKCVRAGGKHNDLEEVGRTARHHTFFEMLGNFSFGDYFKREAIAYGWEFLTGEMGLEPDRLFVTVHYTDDEAAALWTEVAGVAPERIYRLGDKDNFWQMADTGPCGPCSEVHYDLRPAAEWGTVPGTEEFERRGEAGEFLELWNLVFMQFDRDAAGVQTPLPAPSIDTGLGLERLAAVMQGVDSNYHTDLFVPLLERVADVVGRPYAAAGENGVSYRVLADHARAVAFLLGDGVFPSNEGRGYVLRRILRRGVRHAWLLGRREPTLTEVVGAVIDEMADAYPDLAAQRESVLANSLREEERFLVTVDGGMERLERVAPALAAGTSSRPVIAGADVFQLYDTFGFPVDLTRIVAEERGYDLDMEGFEKALEEQRERSRGARFADRLGVTVERRVTVDQAEAWAKVPEAPAEAFVGYDSLEGQTTVIGYRAGVNSRSDLVVQHRPFYLEAGGQVSDRGRIFGAGWSMEVEEIVHDGNHIVLRGRPTGDFPGEAVLGTTVTAQVDPTHRRDTERNHTATHLLHAALRSVLGGHVRQRGSLVAPDRLRFDFAHTAPMTDTELDDVGAMVVEGIWASHPVRTSIRPYAEAVEAGAMALFGEKYGDEVRIVEIPDVSMELCGGTHVRHTGEIGPFVITSESGVAAGVRRIEALTGRVAFDHLAGYKRRIGELAGTVKAQPANVERRVNELLAEKAALEALVDDLQRQDGGGAEILTEAECDVNGTRLTYRGVRIRARGARDARNWGDRFRESGGIGVAVVAAEMPGDKHVLFAFATDSAIAAGVRADAVVREVAAAVGGRGGGRPHMAQAGVADPEGIVAAVRRGAEVVGNLAGK
ncbi:MAG: alanine--tRNA ligase [Gemmatimonadota bacterium]|nr:alanine--tRNA ligase [Gemmatimonadota bacterium]MDE2866196.1 alanine--tRNA ligase [Gemmatimonadota bacterium]MYB07660.1 alanine--tRNA ligase [Gemmatimonadota bacterium]MYG20863.1 alanine--tRNA ligase [Gemmatimonadota bacterium]MYJ39992.1 alanine--tRNA ligase [Gemmatimonadota bacterium]